MKKVTPTSLILFFIGLLAFPSVVEFAHVYTGHNHDFCNHYAEQHIHQDNLECKLFSFQKTPFSTTEIVTFNFVTPKIARKQEFFTYQWPSVRKPLTYGLRAPPVEASFLV